ncbi:MAG: hypothetical protein ABEN55_17395, partial [Bradymonadaceae bacterium]
NAARIRLRAHKPGAAQLRVVTSHGQDVVELEVAKLIRTDLWYWSQALSGARLHFAPDKLAFLRGGTAVLFLGKYGRDGRRLIGSGIEPYVSVRPEDRIAIHTAERATSFLRVAVDQTSSMAFTIRPTPGESESRSVTFDVAAVDRVRSLNLVPPGQTLATRSDGSAAMPVELSIGLLASLVRPGRYDTIDPQSGRVLMAVAMLQFGRRAIGRQKESGGHKLQFGDGTMLVRGIKPGACRIVAHLGNNTARYQFVVVGKPAPG